MTATRSHTGNREKPAHHESTSWFDHLAEAWLVTQGDGGTGSRFATLLEAAGRGDRDAFDRAFSLLYEELSRVARAQRRNWRGNETMSTSVLVHEAYLKLVGGGEVSARWDGRRHFFALAAQAMRQVLVNYAEAQRSAKRGGVAERVPLEQVAEVLTDGAPDDTEAILALHEALQRLAATDERQARIVECRFFGGLSIPETAEALGVSPATVKREWQAASVRLQQELAGSRAV